MQKALIALGYSPGAASVQARRDYKYYKRMNHLEKGKIMQKVRDNYANK